MKRRVINSAVDTAAIANLSFLIVLVVMVGYKLLKTLFN